MRRGHRFFAIGSLALALTANDSASTFAAPHYPWHTSYRAVVDQTAAVLEGTVTTLAESYDDHEGPRTLVTLSQLRVWWGDFRPPDVTLRLFGGAVPGRRGRVDEVHIPTFVQGRRYLVFLSNRDWRLSPITARQAYLIERVHNTDVLVTTDGHATSGIDDVVGPIRTFQVYRVPSEIEDNFVPTVDPSVTSKMVSGAYSPATFVADLKSWASRNHVSVNGAFNSRPYSSGGWRFLRTTPDASQHGAPSAGMPRFAPAGGPPPSPGREAQPCGEHSIPTDGDARYHSQPCLTGGTR